MPRAVLDHGIELEYETLGSPGRAHVAGASMGGMIAQVMAIEHPDRLLTLTSIMSTVGDVRYGRPHPAALEVFLTPSIGDRVTVIAGAERYAVWRSRRWFDRARARRSAAAGYDRSFYPQGAARHLAAVVGSGDRSDALRSVATPTLVIHGLDDTLVDPSGGRRTAELIPGAHLLEVADMGHDLPEPLWPLLAGTMLAHGDVAIGHESQEAA